jgi:hypothetical protein
MKRPDTTRIIVTNNNKWKTFEKKSPDQVVTYNTPLKELEKNRLSRQVASTENEASKLFSLREDRVLTGENFEMYKDESIKLSMINTINPKWKEALGYDLLRFHLNDTKIIIKDEYSLIKIKDGEGQYLEQVLITYIMNNGTQSSFHALVNSETGLVVDTWDRTIHENYKKTKTQLVPTGASNIIGR